jgi:hypothetical protein
MVGIRKQLEARLTRLEARVRGLPDPEAEWERERLVELHYETWSLGGSFEDIPQKDRDPELWETASEYGPVFLGLVREGVLPGYKELLASGVDFTRAVDVGAGIVGEGRNRAPAPNTPHKP